MKPVFNISCPHCGEHHLLAPYEIDDFYDGHVSRCCAPSTLAHAQIAGDRGLSHIIDQLIVTGRMLLRLFGPSGELKDVRLVANLVVDAGKGLIIDRLQGVGGPPAVPDFQAVGTGTTAAAAGNTALETEIGTRVQGALTQPTALTDRLISTFAAGNGTGSITESGRLNASSGGVLLARQVFGVVTKAAGDSLLVQHDVLIS